MADPWFDIATVDHFWIQRRFDVLLALAGELIRTAGEIGEIGCGHGLLQKQIEDRYGRDVTGFDLNDYALQRNASGRSKVCCYDVFQMNREFQSRFDLIFLFDVLEHIVDESAFLKAVLFHLAPRGSLILNVPAGQWLFSAYDRVVGHVRRYSIATLRETATRTGLHIKSCTYWGMPLIPTLMIRKILLLGRQDETQFVSLGMDSRTPALNRMLGLLASCEMIPQRAAGTSLMAILTRKD